MSKVQLAVGQVWKDRKGREVVVTGNDNHDKYPFVGSNDETYTPSGSAYERYTSSEDLIELVQDENGWRPWKATANSQCPVARGALVQVRLADGIVNSRIAANYCWDTACDIEIVAYKIVEQAAKAEEPPAPQPAADGWIPWVATENSRCPVVEGTRVAVRRADGGTLVRNAEQFCWNTLAIGPLRIVAYRVVEQTQKAEEPAARRHSHYFKDVSQIDEIDVYRICDLFEVDDPSGATQHAIKKLLCAGKRGAKDRGKDYREAIDTLNRRLAMWEGE